MSDLLQPEYPEPVIPTDWATDAELNDFDVTKPWSCFHYIAENSYGFTSTHPQYTEAEWLTPIVTATAEYHGPEAARTIQTLVDLHGYAGYHLQASDLDMTSHDLLKLAVVQSEFFRKVRK